MKHNPCNLSTIAAGFVVIGTATAIEIQPTYISQYPDLLMVQGQRDGGLTATRTNTQDPGNRIFRKRGGIPRHQTTSTMMPAPAPSAKGGMAKGGMAKEPIVTTVPSCWEVYGGIGYYTEEYDQVVGFRPAAPGTAAPPPRLYLRADTETDIFGGYVGVERCLGPNWSLGLAIAGSNADVETSIGSVKISDADIDTLSVMPYVSFYGEDVLGAADLWADFMYAYTDQSYDTMLFGGVPNFSSPDGEAHTLDFNIGLTYGSGSFVHGPYAGFRYIDGSIDSQTLIPSGLVIPSQDYKSSVSTLGYSATFPVQVSGGVVAPQVRVAWEHEFEDSNGTLFGLPLAANVEDVCVVGAGVGYYASSGWNVVLNYEGRFADDVEGHYVGLKVGKEF